MLLLRQSLKICSSVSCIFEKRNLNILVSCFVHFDVDVLVLQQANGDAKSTNSSANNSNIDLLWIAHHHDWMSDPVVDC